jgi:tetratricopeptide (TPR) repeat protein
MPSSDIVALVKSGSFYEARVAAERVLQVGKLPAGEMAHLYRLAGQACLALHEYFAAVKYGELALRTAHSARDESTLGMAHFDLSCAYTQIGDGHLAQLHTDEFLKRLPRLTNVGNAEAVVHANRAVILRQHKQWRLAIAALSRAAALYERLDDDRQGAIVALDLARCHCLAGEPLMAEAPLLRVERYLVTSPDHGLAVNLLCTRALYCRLRGDYAASSILCETIFSHGHPGVSENILGEAAWIMGENALDLGQLGEARAYVNSALTHAVRANWPSLMNLASDLRKRIAAGSAAER